MGAVSHGRAEGDVVWIDAAIATLIASYCMHELGADIFVPVSHYEARERRSAFPHRSFGFDCRLADAMIPPQQLFARGERDLHRLAAEYVVTLRRDRPVGRDSLVVGVVCAITFLAMNGIEFRCSVRHLGRLAPRLPTMTPRQIAQQLR